MTTANDDSDEDNDNYYVDDGNDDHHDGNDNRTARDDNGSYGTCNCHCQCNQPSACNCRRQCKQPATRASARPAASAQPSPRTSTQPPPTLCAPAASSHAPPDANHVDTWHLYELDRPAALMLMTTFRHIHIGQAH